jgi:hypothetical protein
MKVRLGCIEWEANRSVLSDWNAPAFEPGHSFWGPRSCAGAFPHDVRRLLGAVSDTPKAPAVAEFVGPLEEHLTNSRISWVVVRLAL